VAAVPGDVSPTPLKKQGPENIVNFILITGNDRNTSPSPFRCSTDAMGRLPSLTAWTGRLAGHNFLAGARNNGRVI
jgi:hypothetical protein